MSSSREIALHQVLRVGGATLVAGCLLVGTMATGAGASSSSTAISQAKKHLLTLANMPKGWTTESGTSSGSGGPNNFPGASQLASCIGVSPSLINNNPPTAYGPYWQNQNQTNEVQDSISIYGSARVARQELGAIGNAKTPSCMTTVTNTGSVKSQIASSVGSGAMVGTVSVAGTNFGRGTGGFTLTISITYQGVTVPTHITEVLFVKGNWVGQMTFNAYGNPFPTSTAKHLVQLAQARI